MTPFIPSGSSCRRYPTANVQPGEQTVTEANDLIVANSHARAIAASVPQCYAGDLATVGSLARAGDLPACINALSRSTVQVELFKQCIVKTIVQWSQARRSGVAPWPRPSVQLIPGVQRIPINLMTNLARFSAGRIFLHLAAMLGDRCVRFHVAGIARELAPRH